MKTLLAHLERPDPPRLRWRDLRADLGTVYVANGVIGFVFAATAPMAIILSVGSRAGLGEAQLASWIFGVFFLNGLLTIAFCALYRQPLAFFWTIPGTVLVGPTLAHAGFAEVVGAYLATGVLMLVLGLTGWVRRAMAAVPMPIVMGMVAGVFLRFGTDLVRSVHADLAVAGSMVAVFLLLSAVPGLGRRVPPLIGALVVGIGAVVATGRMAGAGIGQLELAAPLLQAPAWSLPVLVELVVPLAITVLVVQNGQGFAVVRTAGHAPPVDAVTVACGVGSILASAVGAISTCLTGPTNAILTASGERSRQYTAGLVTGTLAVVFGLLAPTFTRLMLAAPPAFVMALAGLAMLRALQGAFVGAFKDRCTLGALVAFLVTVTDLSLLNIGAAFWGLVAGLVVSTLLERGDLAALRQASR